MNSFIIKFKSFIIYNKNYSEDKENFLIKIDVFFTEISTFS
jgi:hypothetical protein